MSDKTESEKLRAVIDRQVRAALCGELALWALSSDVNVPSTRGADSGASAPGLLRRVAGRGRPTQTSSSAPGPMQVGAATLTYGLDLVAEAGRLEPVIGRDQGTRRFR